MLMTSLPHDLYLSEKLLLGFHVSTYPYTSHINVLTVL